MLTPVTWLTHHVIVPEPVPVGAAAALAPLLPLLPQADSPSVRAAAAPARAMHMLRRVASLRAGRLRPVWLWFIGEILSVSRETGSVGSFVEIRLYGMQTN